MSEVMKNVYLTEDRARVWMPLCTRKDGLWYVGREMSLEKSIWNVILHDCTIDYIDVNFKKLTNNYSDLFRAIYE